MKRSIVLFGLCLWACAKSPAQAPSRAEVRRITPSTIEIIPAAGQLPYCLVFTTSETGVIRQLTLTRDNRSLECPAEKPIGNVRFRIPVDEGKVKVRIIFSEKQLNAASIAQQLLDFTSRPDFTALDLRAPGKVFMATYEFAPEAEPQATVGERITRTESADAGTAPADAGGVAQGP